VTVILDNWQELTDTILGGEHSRSIRTNFVSFHQVVLEQKIFKDFQFFNRPEAMAVILH